VLVEGVENIVCGGVAIVASMEFAANAAKVGLVKIWGFPRLRPTWQVHGGRFREAHINGEGLGAGIGRVLSEE
jgi:hypothetical protein